MTSKQIKPTRCPDDAPIPGVYQHYKGNLYQVFGLSRHSETEEWLVVYQALYGEKGYWVRPLTIWLEPVRTTTETSEANTERFKLVDANDIDLDRLTQHS